MMSDWQIMILFALVGFVASIALSLAIWNRNDFEERISLLEKKLKEKDNEQTHE
ncbi:MAG: hypothetical protein IIZ94_00350 [Prevotella sp.]|nr:hypothetical protein [Prevotella sp.]